MSAVCVALIVMGVAAICTARSDRGVTVTYSDEEKATATGARGGLVVVHVAGAVRYPGVHQLLGDARANDAILAAGGFTAIADRDAINLAAHVEDGQRIFVPSRTSPMASASSPGRATVLPKRSTARSTRAESVTPSGQTVARPPGRTATAQASTRREFTLPGTGQPSRETAQSGTEVTSRQTQQDAKAGQVTEKRGAASVAAVSFPVNVNIATEQQLQSIPGVGPVLATRIVAHRMEFGPFRRLEDLGRVKGIGKATQARLAGYVSF